MKKTYIEPKNTVVSINLETMIAGSVDDVTVDKSAEKITDSSDFGGREVIKSSDAWEEW